MNQTDTTPNDAESLRKSTSLSSGPGRIRKFVWPSISILCLLFAGFSVLYTFPKVILMPGTADSVGDRLEVSGVKEHPAKGKILWATVAEVLEPHLLDMVDAKLRSDVEIQPKEILGGISPAQDKRENAVRMNDSKQVAEVIVARKLGFKTSGGAVRVDDIDQKSPAAKMLKKGDEIVSADGKSFCLVNDLRPVLANHKSGDVISMQVWRSGLNKPLSLEVPLESAKDEQGNTRAIIGILAGPSVNSPCTAPFEVSFRTGQIGGPSAGLAMTLALLDRLTPGDLTGGKSVAVTGTIEADGSVGDVGGVREKTFAVRRAGAKLFIVPTSEVAEAKLHAKDMAVVGVKNLDEALAALQKFGGAPLPAVG